jgi:ectoine hydroxylase-related dioxygenase (phytanoyl-CoA dioxygenase family)
MFSDSSTSSLDGGVPFVRHPTAVSVSAREISSDKTSFETIQRALEAFHRDGIVILQDAIPHEPLNHLHRKMEEDVHTLLARNDPHFNHGKSAQNLSQRPPISKEYLHEAIWANRHASAVMQNLLGPNFQLAFYGANTAIPNGTGRQAVHSDAYFRHLDFTFGVEVNIFLSDVSAENGVTEIWPGTHHGFNFKDHVPNTRGWIKKARLDARAEILPPVQPTVPKGSIVIRDLRTWHSGMPNHTNDPRIMLAFIYFPAWYRTSMRLIFPQDVRPLLQSWKQVDMLSTANFVDGEVNHLNLPFSMNLTQDANEEIGRTQRKKRRVGEKPRVSDEHYWTPPATPAINGVKSFQFSAGARPITPPAFSSQDGEREPVRNDSISSIVVSEIEI